MIGIFFIRLKEKTLNNLIEYLVSFAVGGLLGGSFFHLLPESLETENPSIFTYVLSGIVFFFLIERGRTNCPRVEIRTISTSMASPSKHSKTKLIYIVLPGLPDAGRQPDAKGPRAGR